MDYAHPMKLMEMSLGGKYTTRDGESDFNSLIPINEENGNNKNGNNRFLNKQHIYTIYNSYNLKIKDWGISLGARFEGTENKANFYATNTEIKQRYSNLIPSFQLLKKFKNISSVNLGYTQRIQRPDINLMNPFVNKSDPTFYFVGNPDLSPVTNHTFSLGYSWFKKGFVNIGTNYSSARNTIQRVIELKEENISYATYYNIGKDRRFDINLNTNYPLTKAINLSLNGTVSYVNVNGSVQGAMYENDGMQGNAYMYINYSIPKIARISANLGYYSPTVILQGSSNGYVYSSLSASKQLLKNKLTISGSVSNPFQKYRTVENRIRTADFSQAHRYKNYFRNFSLNLSYNFGKLEKPIKKNKKGIKNEDKIENIEKAEKGVN
ncbi:outer membrane beta-barrel family protein [Sphingobacterium lumbrici]|uniref:outer membrane beta-barrel family protein n=1 Tax=Sphingobacterium lumbrici TaxID=2559600 RepID=UPI0021CFD525|nr:outer membrane beta-barrel family protein [Sphingobacterium lumbrici]